MVQDRRIGMVRRQRFEIHDSRCGQKHLQGQETVFSVHAAVLVEPAKPANGFGSHDHRTHPRHEGEQVHGEGRLRATVQAIRLTAQTALMPKRYGRFSRRLAHGSRGHRGRFGLLLEQRDATLEERRRPLIVGIQECQE